VGEDSREGARRGSSGRAAGGGRDATGVRYPRAEAHGSPSGGETIYLLIAMAAVVVLAVVLLGRGRSAPVTRLRFVRGRLVEERGALAGNLARELADVARRSEVTGRLELGRDGEIAFSGPISEQDRQRFRNVVAVHGSVPGR